MIKKYESDWHGIVFSSFTALSSKNIANKGFYEEFYCEFNKKFQTYEDISDEWKADKNDYADELIKIIEKKDNILSIGCGIGYIENEISLRVKKNKLIGIEPSIYSYNFMRKNTNVVCLNGNFPEIIKDDLYFDFAYMRAVEYVFNNNEYELLLRSVVDYGINDFLVISMSHYNPLLYHTKNIIKFVFSKLGLYKYSFEGMQFWGYARTKREHIHALKKAGFNRVEVKTFKDSLFIRGFRE